MIKTLLLLLCALTTCAYAAEKISCPIELETAQANKDYGGWKRGSFNPLRLTDAELMFITSGDPLEAILMPDTTKPVADPNHTVYYFFDLGRRKHQRPFTLLCYYGQRNEYLERTLPASVNHCQFTRWNPGDAPSFEATCH